MSTDFETQSVSQIQVNVINGKQGDQMLKQKGAQILA